jgi:hypothetical protein
MVFLVFETPTERKMLCGSKEDDEQCLLEEEQRSKSSCISVVVLEKLNPECTAARLVVA